MMRRLMAGSKRDICRCGPLREAARRARAVLAHPGHVTLSKLCLRRIGLGARERTGELGACLGIALGEPMFVTEIRPETNTVVMGREDALIRNHMMVGKVNLMKYPALPGAGLETVTKVRYRDAGTMSTLQQIGNDVEATFHANVKGIAPGQSAVFYEGDDVVGGGIIQGSGVFL